MNTKVGKSIVGSTVAERDGFKRARVVRLGVQLHCLCGPASIVKGETSRGQEEELICMF